MGKCKLNTYIFIIHPYYMHKITYKHAYKIRMSRIFLKAQFTDAINQITVSTTKTWRSRN